MNGYSKISSQKSRSIDFSDLFSFPQTPKTKRNTAHTAKLPEDEEPPNHAKTTTPEAEAEAERSGDRFGVMLGRSGSVSSAASSGFQATMKRAFSMRRSSSVSEKYCRIHDQFMVITSSSSSSPVGEYDDNNTITDPAVRRSTNNKHSHSHSHSHRGGRGGGKILRACKRLLGL